eukprot:TRINITY_DN2609_c1_g2_i1.p1 TRINITY_DN2609_c1_g2~~TRINITY_DN2609_c1_g2_i1.p1  ORF type:complete len:489 (+),score=134.30 TRINITY_DN2609_c1_g2_i1:600-2066(+)
MTSIFSTKTFEDFNLNPDLLHSIKHELKFEHPTVVQSAVLAHIQSVDYGHVLVHANNGHGKTGAFLLWALSSVDMSRAAPQVIILANTRELANQIYIEAQKFAKQMRNTNPSLQIGKILSTGVAKRTRTKRTAGETNVSSAEDTGSRDSQIIIGTPGIISREIANGRLSSDYLELIILDEVDALLFMENDNSKAQIVTQIVGIKNICENNENRKVKNELRFGFFSATYPPSTKAVIKEAILGTNSSIKIVRPQNSSIVAETLTHFAMRCEEDKLPTFVELYERIPITQSIVFVNNSKKTDILVPLMTERLKNKGISFASFYGKDRLGTERDQIIETFREREILTLISTDALARGFDDLDVTLVINFDIPFIYDNVKNEETNLPNREVFQHRIHRTGRIGHKGLAITLVKDKRDEEAYENICKFLEVEAKYLTFDELAEEIELVEEHNAERENAKTTDEVQYIVEEDIDASKATTNPKKNIDESWSATD